MNRIFFAQLNLHEFHSGDILCCLPSLNNMTLGAGLNSKCYLKFSNKLLISSLEMKWMWKIYFFVDFKRWCFTLYGLFLQWYYQNIKCDNFYSLKIYAFDGLPKGLLMGFSFLSEVFSDSALLIFHEKTKS